MRIIEEQLGGPLASHFEEFERAPIAAASLGQVHRARWNGRRVVVKVQRPGLRELFEIDLKNLRCAPHGGAATGVCAAQQCTRCAACRCRCNAV